MAGRESLLEDDSRLRNEGGGGIQGAGGVDEGGTWSCAGAFALMDQKLAAAVHPPSESGLAGAAAAGPALRRHCCFLPS